MSNFYNQASWVLVPSGIEEDIVFSQKPISGLGDLSFTRASDATYTDASGVVRRSPYNLLTWSEDFTNAAWIKQEVTISPNVAIAPNGIQSADKITPSTLNTVHQIRMDSVVSASQCTFGVFAKADGYSTIEILDRISATDGAIFNLSNGTFTNKGSGIGKIENYGNGWYRCTVTANTTGIRIYVPSSASSAGNGTSGIFIWGAQLVEGSSALDYFPTTDRLNVPRIDFRNADGTLSSCGRLLLEPQRTNSILNSLLVGGIPPTSYQRPLTGGTITAVPSIYGNADGATALQFIVSNAQDCIEAGNISIVSGNTYTFSVYIESITGNIQAVNFMRISGSHTGTITYKINGQAIASTTNISAGLFELNIAATATTSNGLRIGAGNGLGAVTATLRISRPQAELGAYPTSRIPTTTAAVTRLADTASKTGVSSLIGQTEGTLFAEVDLSTQTTTGLFRRILMISNGDENTSSYLRVTETNTIQFVSFDGGAQALISSLSPALGRIKVAAAYKANDFVLYINGVLQGTDTSGTIPATRSVIRVGQSDALVAVHNLNDRVAQAALFPTRLTNAQLAQLTTL